MLKRIEKNKYQGNFNSCYDELTYETEIKIKDKFIELRIVDSIPHVVLSANETILFYPVKIKKNN